MEWPPAAVDAPIKKTAANVGIVTVAVLTVKEAAVATETNQ